MGIAVEIWLLSCVQAEIYVFFYILPANDRHLWFITHPDIGQFLTNLCFLTPKTWGSTLDFCCYRVCKLIGTCTNIVSTIRQGGIQRCIDSTRIEVFDESTIIRQGCFLTIQRFDQELFDDSSIWQECNRWFHDSTRRCLTIHRIDKDRGIRQFTNTTRRYLTIQRFDKNVIDDSTIRQGDVWRFNGSMRSYISQLCSIGLALKGKFTVAGQFKRSFRAKFNLVS